MLRAFSVLCLGLLAATTAAAVEIVSKPALPAGITIFDTPRGPVFATPEGMTIYKAIPKGRAGKQVEVTGQCVVQCPEDWPPLRPGPGAKDIGDFSIVSGVNGMKQWAYKGVLLQTFKYDRNPGDTLGDDTFDFNGPRVPVGEAAWVESDVAPEEPPPMPAITQELPPGVKVQLGFAGNRYFADQAGFTLYAYEGNGRCADACLKTHRPLVAAALARPIGPWSALAHEDGTRVWAYNGKPVYTYLKDAHPGEAMGEDGEGKWRALVEYKAELPSEVSTGMTETGPVYIEKATGKTLYYQGFNHRPYIYVGFHKGVFSNCYNECAEAYPPLLAAPGAKPVGEWWLLTRVDGTKQWAYRGLPIYTYRADTPGRHLAAANGRIWTEAIANNPNTLRLR